MENSFVSLLNIEFKITFDITEQNNGKFYIRNNIVFNVVSYTAIQINLQNEFKDYWELYHEKHSNSLHKTRNNRYYALKNPYYLEKMLVDLDFKKLKKIKNKSKYIFRSTNIEDINKIYSAILKHDAFAEHSLSHKDLFD